MPENTLSTEPELLRVREAAELATLSVASIWRLIRSGELEAVRLGSKPGSPVRVPSRALRAWLYQEEAPS